jgi:predicted branched-subunit amino acid permease
MDRIERAAGRKAMSLITGPVAGGPENAATARGVRAGDGTDTGRRAAFVGARAMAPLSLGLLPFGVTIGAAASASMPTVTGWSVAVLLYGGSTQLAAVQLLGAGAGAVAVILAVAVTNARMLIYSSAMREHWRGTSLWWRLLASYFLVDPMVVVCATDEGRQADLRRRIWFYLGAAVTLWLPWFVANGVGYSIGDQLPSYGWMGLLTPLVLTGLLSRMVTTRPALLAALVAAGLAIALDGLAHDLGFVVAGVLGVAAAVRAERFRSTRGGG